jgi:inner membrane protein
MDPISQGVLGAVVSQSFAKNKKEVGLACLCGTLGGLAADLDIFIRSKSDPLLHIEYHRHFTHSLAFIPIGGLLVTLFIWGIMRWRNKINFWSVYLFATLGYATHGLLDACTSYGTRLFWPFSNMRVSWNLVSIIDPVFTVPLLLFIMLSVVKKSRKIAQVGLCLALLYLGAGFIQQQRVAAEVESIARERGHSIERMFLNPTFGNNILWRSIYQVNGHFYVDAVRAPWFLSVSYKEGSSVPVLDSNKDFPDTPTDSIKWKDIERFSYFSQGYIYRYPYRENVIGDIRYGTLPYDLRSLWGLDISGSSDVHAPFLSLRNFDQSTRDRLWQMIFGGVLEASVGLESVNQTE